MQISWVRILLKKTCHQVLDSPNICDILIKSQNYFCVKQDKLIERSQNLLMFQYPMISVTTTVEHPNRFPKKCETKFLLSCVCSSKFKFHDL